jgi:hypothetical protein
MLLVNRFEVGYRQGVFDAAQLERIISLTLFPRVAGN